MEWWEGQRARLYPVLSILPGLVGGGCSLLLGGRGVGWVGLVSVLNRGFAGVRGVQNQVKVGSIYSCKRSLVPSSV